MHDLTGRSAIVTGGASGIGAACARALAACGAAVTVADIGAEHATALADEIGGRTWIVDLLDTEALESISLDTDILVNCAGMQKVAPIVDLEPATFRTIQKLMVEVPFLLTRAALPKMITNRFGRIINISSIHGLRASAYKSAYVAAKHGLEGLSKVIALEGGPHGITSNCVSPGYVRTPLVTKQLADQAAAHGISEDDVLQTILLPDTAIKRLVEPHEVAALVSWLASDEASMVSGASYSIDGGRTAK
ncbi:SDR family oxidoreductase [Rhodococcus koreensis]